MGATGNGSDAAEVRTYHQVEEGPDVRIVWEKVKSPAHWQLINQITAVNPRRTRKERRAFKVLTQKAARWGLLEVVPEDEETG
jgi:hypothetical protein